jgi:hypothetical protein
LLLVGRNFYIPEELDEKLLEVEMLLASLDGRLALRRWASRALHTSYCQMQMLKLHRKKQQGVCGHLIFPHLPVTEIPPWQPCGRHRWFV